MEKKKIVYCPVCKEERKFVRVVETHEEQERFTMHTPIGVSLPTWVEETELPIAYCSVCKIVIHIGPSAEEVKKDFETRERKRKEKQGLHLVRL